LADGDPATDVRSVFSWSYRALSAPAARLFRLMGLHPGPTIGVPASANMAGLPQREAGPLLDELTRAHLLIEFAPGRYGFHDLLRAYAAEQAEAVDGDEAGHAAIHRVLDYYVHTADPAATMLLPKRLPIPLPRRQLGTSPEHLNDYESALSWFEVQHDELIAAVHRAAAGFEGHAWRLAWILRTFLPMRGRAPENVEIQRVGLAASVRLNDPVANAHAHLSLAFSVSESDPVEAEAHGRRSLDLFTELGDLTKMAQAHCALLSVAADAGRPADGLPHAERAQDLFRQIGDQVWEAFALGGVGWCHMLIGNHEQAVEHCTRALHLLQELGDKDGQAGTWESLGSAYDNLAEYEKAATCYRNAIELYAELDHRPWQAYTLNRLGDVHQVTGDTDAARDAWQRALDILDGLNDPDVGTDAKAIRAKLQPGAA
jgi:tetratricopeptide (TPR) repeat protein